MTASAMTLTESARAKINLTLRVRGKRPDGYHEIESLVVFAAVADIVHLDPGVELALEVAGTDGGMGPPQDNLVIKAARALAERRAGIAVGHFRLEKRLPVAAGIGGGSADAAAALRLLARANGMAADAPVLFEVARSVGADVPVCLASGSRLMRGIGEALSPPLRVPELAAVLVNPRVAVATAEVFARLAAKPLGASRHENDEDVPNTWDALLDYLDGRGNDLQAAAISLQPIIADVLRALGDLPGCRLARMSGSGATCFGLFEQPSESEAAARLLREQHPDWWIAPTSLAAAREA